MHNDNPDTIAIEESNWIHTEVDDVFLPSVRVQLAWKDVEAAVERGAVVPQQAHLLWATWAASTSGLRVGAPGVTGAAAMDTVPSGLTADGAGQPGPLRRHGLAIGLIVGLLLGATATALALGG